MSDSRDEQIALLDLLAQAASALEDCVSAIDTMMGDTDIEGDDSPEFVACQNGSKALAALRAAKVIE